MNPRNWDEAVKELINGRLILIKNVPANMVTGRLSSRSGINHKHRVNVRTTPEGVATWLTPKEEA